MDVNITPADFAKLDNRLVIQEQRTSTIEGSLSRINSTLDRMETKQNEGQRTPWQLFVSVSALIFAAGGSLFYLGITPLKEQNYRMEKDLTVVQNSIKNSITDKDFQFSKSETEKKFDNVLSVVAKLADGQVPRKEHERVWLSYDQQLDAIKAQILANSIDKQRQIDELKQANASTYNVRDVILDVRQRLDRVERLKHNSDTK